MAASLDTIIDVSISANTTTPSRPGFGIPLFCGYHTKYADIVRTYNKASELVDDGFATTDPLYLMAAAAFSQKPRPAEVKIGRLTTAVKCRHVITVTTATEGEVISFTLVSPDGTVNSISRTVPAASNTTAEAAAVELLVEACSGIDSSAANADVTIESTAAGNTFYVYDL